MTTLHTMSDVFRKDAPRVTFKVAKQACGRNFREFLDRVFVRDPDEWYLNNFHGVLKSLKAAPGLKLRIPISDIEMWRGNTTPQQEMIDLLRKTFSLADLVVFSPAPQWYCRYTLLDQHPWPEFSKGFYGCTGPLGTIYHHMGMDEYYSWYAAMRPLIVAGRVAYLPRLNTNWRGARLRLPRLEGYATRYVSEDVADIARNALLDLCIDHMVSQRLGFLHVSPKTSDFPIVTASIAARGITGKLARRAHIIMRLRIPSIENASLDELWKIQQDEWPSFDAFRRSIRLAVEAASAKPASETELETHVERIHREYINEPLSKLEDRLRRIQRIRRRKWGAYALVSTSAVLVSAIAPNVAVPITSGLGALSIVKIMEAYFSDIEKDVPLSSEALYWLARLRQKKRASS